MKKILLANYFGQGWSALMGIAFLPLIIKSIGAEAYGLVGVYAMLQAWFALLDMGITPTLNREMARYIGGAHSSQSIRDLLRSLFFKCHAFDWHVRIPCFLIGPDLKKTMFLLLFTLENQPKSSYPPSPLAGVLGTSAT